eukprot:gene8026-9871_t
MNRIFNQTSLLLFNNSSCGSNSRNVVVGSILQKLNYGVSTRIKGSGIYKAPKSTLKNSFQNLKVNQLSGEAVYNIKNIDYDNNPFESKDEFSLDRVDRKDAEEVLRTEYGVKEDEMDVYLDRKKSKSDEPQQPRSYLVSPSSTPPSKIRSSPSASLLKKRQSYNLLLFNKRAQEDVEENDDEDEDEEDIAIRKFRKYLGKENQKKYNEMEEEEEHEEEEEDEKENELAQDENWQEDSNQLDSNSGGKTYYSEYYEFDEDTRKDDDFIRRESLNNSGFNVKKLPQNENNQWEEIDDDEDFESPEMIKKNLEKQKIRELEKKGVTMRGDTLFVGEAQIPEKFNSFFLDPLGPTSRQEKNFFSKLEALKASKKERIKKKRKLTIDENLDMQSIVQRRMATRILDILNDTPLFNHEGVSRLDDDTKGNGPSHFDNPGNFDLDDLREDPILAKSGIVLTKALMSSDLRWVKVYWTRTKNMNEYLKVDHDKKQTAEYDEVVEDGSGIKEYFENLQLPASRQLAYERFKDQMYGDKNSIKSESQDQQSSIQSKSILIKNNNNNNNNNNIFSFGGVNQPASINQVELNLNLPETENEIEGFIDPRTVKKPKKTKDDFLRELEFNKEFNLEHNTKKKSKKKLLVSLENISDSDVIRRLEQVKKQCRYVIGKRLQTKYVPDIYFAHDTTTNKQELASDLFQSFIIPQVKNFILKDKEQKEKKQDTLRSKFSGLFHGNNNSSTSSSGGDRHSTIEFGEQDEIDLEDILSAFPEIDEPEVLDYIAGQKPKRQQEEGQSGSSVLEDMLNDKEPEEQEDLSEIEKNREIFKQFNKSQFKD